MADFPSNVSYGTVTGDMSWFMADSPTDIDTLPERRPVLGTVRFTPKVDAVVNVEARQVYFCDTMSVSTDEFGRFSIDLVATSADHLSPSGWTYLMEVKPDVSLGGRASQGFKFNITLAPGEVLDLSEIILRNQVKPTPSSGGTTTVPPSGSDVVWILDNTDPDGGYYMVSGGA